MFRLDNSTMHFFPSLNLDFYSREVKNVLQKADLTISQKLLQKNLRCKLVDSHVLLLYNI